MLTEQRTDLPDTKRIQSCAKATPAPVGGPGKPCRVELNLEQSHTRAAVYRHARSTRTQKKARSCRYVPCCWVAGADPHGPGKGGWEGFTPFGAQLLHTSRNFTTMCPNLGRSLKSLSPSRGSVQTPLLLRCNKDLITGVRAASVDDPVRVLSGARSVILA